MVSASAAVSGLVLNCEPYKYPLTNSARSAALVMEKSNFNLFVAIVSPLCVKTDKSIIYPILILYHIHCGKVKFWPTQYCIEI